MLHAYVDVLHFNLTYYTFAKRVVTREFSFLKLNYTFTTFYNYLYANIAYKLYVETSNI